MNNEIKEELKEIVNMEDSIIKEEVTIEKEENKEEIKQEEVGMLSFADIVISSIIKDSREKVEHKRKDNGKLKDVIVELESLKARSGRSFKRLKISLICEKTTIIFVPKIRHFKFSEDDMKEIKEGILNGKF